jgi:prepilin-type N-terminal cleavage/methylation domain-containing protein
MKRMRGLSLPEILVAAGIIAIATAIAVPIYASIAQQGVDNQIFTDTTRIKMAIEKYQSDWFALPETLASIGMEDVTDPWGDKYVYVRTGPDVYQLFSSNAPGLQ